MKILYAAGNSYNSQIQLRRFLNAIENNKNYTIKIAAFKKSSPPYINIDWTLDCMLNMFNPESTALDYNDNFSLYFNMVKDYNPNLIISDMEYFTSDIANTLGITLWQCSSSIINFALSFDYKYQLGIFKQYSFLFNRNPIHTQRITNILENSDKIFIYSHFGDTAAAPILKSNYEWIRPYHMIGKNSSPCHHNIVGASLKNDKQLISIIKNYNDSVFFSPFPFEKYGQILMKSIENSEEYYCNIKNSNIFVCSGQTSFLADAFYNNKYSAILYDVTDSESVLNGIISNNLKLSCQINDLSILNDNYIECNINNNIKYLHQKVDELDI